LVIANSKKFDSESLVKEMMERRRTALVLFVVVVVLTWQEGVLGKWLESTAKEKTGSWAGWVSDKITT